jgi:catechol 2,3-dioxygenase-like lactoylglutathione lyase family enzyme
MAKKSARDKSSEIVVFEIVRDSRCAECGEELWRSDRLRMEADRPLCMACADLARSIAWYAEIGWSVRAQGVEDATPWASLVLPEDPTFSLELEQVHGLRGGVPRTANTQGLYRIALAVDDVREAHAGLLRTGMQVPAPVFIPMPDTPTGGFTVLFLTDPDPFFMEVRLTGQFDFIEGFEQVQERTTFDVVGSADGRFRDAVDAVRRPRRAHPSG